MCLYIYFDKILSYYLINCKEGGNINIAAIIAEYNPLHKGHLYQINKTREISKCDALICIMSGNFVQRGEPALIDKWNRTKMALENGIDLVLELPVIYSLSSAEFFASGAISILHKLGVIESICFGSECGDINILNHIAELLVTEPEAYKQTLKCMLSNGMPFPAARSSALSEYIKKVYPDYDIHHILNSSNNILGIEYCKSLIRNKSSIKAFTIKREGGAYNSKNLNTVFSSATSIREIIKSGASLELIKAHMPQTSFSVIEDIFSHYSFSFGEDMFKFLKYKILQSPLEIKKLPDVKEGLENRIYDCIKNSISYEDLINKVKTKRYTYTRISRCLCQLFVGFELFDTNSMRHLSPDYVRILGFNKKGTEVLRNAKEKSSIDIYTKLPSKTTPILDLDIMSTKMYSMINSSVQPDSDFKTGPIIYK